MWLSGLNKIIYVRLSRIHITKKHQKTENTTILYKIREASYYYEAIGCIVIIFIFWPLSIKNLWLYPCVTMYGLSIRISYKWKGFSFE